MPDNLWKICRGEAQIRRLSAKPWRAVEAQHKVVTRKLVDSLEEQSVLEELLEKNKPPLPQNGDKHKQLHYLLSTPFRYPPLKHGSRYGTRQHRGIWYGSARIKTVLCEVAYYRFLFLQGSSAELDTVYADFTLFKASIRTSRGVDLTRQPFVRYKSGLTHASDYSMTQALGNRMREANVHAFRCFSARDTENGINIAVLNGRAFDIDKPLEFQHWHSVTNTQQVEFIKRDLLSQTVFTFDKQSLSHG